jgi:hypothetical protein
MFSRAVRVERLLPEAVLARAGPGTRRTWLRRPQRGNRGPLWCVATSVQPTVAARPITGRSFYCRPRIGQFAGSRGSWPAHAASDEACGLENLAPCSGLGMSLAVRQGRLVG